LSGYRDANARPGGTFFLEVTPLGWRLMGGYGLLLFALSVTNWWIGRSERADLAKRIEHGLVDEAAKLPSAPEFWRFLELYPPQGGAAMNEAGAGFHWWQVLTAPFVFTPGSFALFALAFIGFAFFAAGVERFLGTRRFLMLWLVASFGSGLGGFLFGPLLDPVGTHFGCGPAVLAVIIVYCLITPEAIVSFFMVVPIKLKWIALTVAAWVVVRALAMTAPLGLGESVGGYELGGVLAGFFWFRYGEDFFEKRRRRRRAGVLLQAVLDEVEENLEPDEPTYH